MIIEIQKLRLDLFIGVWEWEQQTRQPIFVTLQIKLKESPKKDDLSETVDYDALTRKITKITETRRYHLIETLAEDMMGLLSEEEKIAWAHLQIEKPGALEKAGTVSVKHEKTFAK